jgi:hypothetical protein
LRVPRIFDWKQARNFHSALADKAGQGLLLTPDIENHVRIQNFIRKRQHGSHTNAPRDAMVDLGDQYGLSLMAAARLFVELQSASSRFALGESLEGYLRAGDFLKNLEEIRFPLSRLAAWSSAMLNDGRPERLAIAEKHLENAAHFWADALRSESERPGQYERWELAKMRGFHHTRNTQSSGAIYHDYNSAVVLRTWLRNNVLFSDLLTKAIERESARRRHDATNPDPDRYMSMPELSGIVRLTGVTLPRMYERYTRKSFGISRGIRNAVRDATGVRFVRLAMMVMGLEPVSPEAIAKNWRKAKNK